MTRGLLALLAALLLAPLPGVPPSRPLRWLPRRRRPRTAAADAEWQWVMALVGELRAGSDPARALRVCAEQHAVAPHAARAARLGADVAAALRMDAAGTRSLVATVAGVWELQSSSGAGLADVVEQMAESHRRSRDVRRTLAVELAGPRATARTMSLLPVFGIGLGIMLGADPLTWLTTTPWGLAVLLCGVSANVAGFVWIRAIVASVESAL